MAHFLYFFPRLCRIFTEINNYQKTLNLTDVKKHFLITVLYEGKQILDQ